MGTQSTWEPEGKTRRYWFRELMKLNETYKIPCYGKNCGSEGDDPFKPKPPAPPAPHGSYTVQSGDSCWAIADKLCQDGTIGRPTFATQIPCARCSTLGRASSTTAVARALTVGRRRCSSESQADKGFDYQFFWDFNCCSAHVLRLQPMHF